MRVDAWHLAQAWHLWCTPHASCDAFRFAIVAKAACNCRVIIVVALYGTGHPCPQVAGMTPLQMLRAVLSRISHSSLPFLIERSSTAPPAPAHGHGNAASARPDLSPDAFAMAFQCVFLDYTGHVNLAAEISSSKAKMVSICDSFNNDPAGLTCQVIYLHCIFYPDHCFHFLSAKTDQGLASATGQVLF